MLPRRADAIEVIGEALVAAADGEGHRPIAARLGRPGATVRGWLRRFAARAPQTIAHAAGLVYRHDLAVMRVQPTEGASPTQAALELLARAAAAIEMRMGQARCRWQVVSALCSSRLLANTSCPYPPSW